MKSLILVASLLVCGSAFATNSVVDSLYQVQPLLARDPSSNSEKFCIITSDQKSFANACYSSMEFCAKRAEYWQDLPGAKKHACVKI